MDTLPIFSLDIIAWHLFDNNCSLFFFLLWKKPNIGVGQVESVQFRYPNIGPYCLHVSSDLLHILVDFLSLDKIAIADNIVIVVIFGSVRLNSPNNLRLACGPSQITTGKYLV